MLRIYDLEKQFRRPLTLAELIEDVIGPDISPSTAAIFVETWLRTEHIRQVGDHYSLDIRGQNCVSDHLNSRRKQR